MVGRSIRPPAIAASPSAPPADLGAMTTAQPRALLWPGRPVGRRRRGRRQKGYFRRLRLCSPCLGGVVRRYRWYRCHRQSSNNVGRMGAVSTAGRHGNKGDAVAVAVAVDQLLYLGAGGAGELYWLARSDCLWCSFSHAWWCLRGVARGRIET